MVKTSDWVRLVLISIGVVLFFRLPPDMPERAKLAEAIPVQVEDEVPEPPENDGYVNEKDLPPAEEGGAVIGADRAFGEKYPFIEVDDKRLDFDRDSGHYHHAGTKQRALFTRFEDGKYVLVTEDAWDDAVAVMNQMPKKPAK